LAMGQISQSLFYHFCVLCSPSFVQWSTFAWVFVPQGKQLRPILPLLSGGSHEPDCMDEMESRC
jgi:hypothetical protein